MYNSFCLTIFAIVALLLSGCSSEVENTETPSLAERTPPVTQDEALSPKEELKSAPSKTKDKPFSSMISKSPEGAEVFFLEPQNGATLTSPVTIKFGIKNMVVAKAGEQVESSGHHHLLINLDELPELDVPLPATDQIIHFGGAQTETSIDLPAGEHQLQLLLGNYLHIPHDKPVLSEKITITVK